MCHVTRVNANGTRVPMSTEQQLTYLDFGMGGGRCSLVWRAPEREHFASNPVRSLAMPTLVLRNVPDDLYPTGGGVTMGPSIG